MTIDVNKFRNPDILPALRPEDLGGATAAILTVESVNPDVVIERRQMLTIVPREFPERQLYCNGTSVRYLVDRLGNDETAWIGKQFPVLVVEVMNPATRTRTKTLWVEAPALWEEAFEAAGVKRPRTKTATRSTRRTQRVPGGVGRGRK